MIIAIDAGCLGVKDERLKGGIYTIAAHLLQELGKIDKKNTYLLYSFYPIKRSLLELFGSNFKNIIVKPSKGWNKVWLPLRLKKDSPDVYLALNQALPLYHPFKIISFVHGLDFVQDSYEDTKKLKKLKKNTDHCIRNSDRIITVSCSLKKEIEKIYKSRQISVLHPGVSSIFNKKGNIYQSKKNYFLFIGGLKPSKNIPILLEAFSLFLKITKKDYNLILAGSDLEKDKKIDLVIRKLEIGKKIIFTIIKNEDLPQYLRGATGFVSPSLYESFGLPFLEAMASGCPVIGSDRGGIPEVVGDAGILVDPFDVQGLANAMVRVAEDKKLRDAMIEKGLRQAKKFSWENFAQQVYAVINSV